MVKLYVGLVSAVLLSVLAVSWLTGELVDHLSAPYLEQENAHNLALILQLGRLADGGKSDALATASHDPIRLVRARDYPLPPELEQQLARDGAVALADHYGHYLLGRVISDPDHYVMLRVADQSRAMSTLDMVMTLLFYGAISLLFALWLLPLIVKLSALATAANQFGRGDLAVRVIPSRWSYVESLELSFNRMAAQIQSLVAENRVLTVGLSHDLRTPLACLRFGIDAAREATTLNNKDGYLDRVESDLVRMEQMISAFLEYAALKRDSGNLKRMAINVDEMVTGLVVAAAHLRPDLTIRCQQEILERLQIWGDPLWLERALRNVINNGMRFARTQLLIRVTHDADGAVVIAIDDDGDGLLNPDVDLFTPFAKLHSKSAAGSSHEVNLGLGLAIAAQVMAWHGGTLGASNSGWLSGASFAFRFSATSRL